MSVVINDSNTKTNTVFAWLLDKFIFPLSYSEEN